MSYAIFKAVGEQVKAKEGDLLRVPKIEGEPGTEVTFDEVLFSADGDDIKTGRPTVEGAQVTAEIVRHGRGVKVVVFKFKRRKKYRRKTGHRQDFTEIKVTGLKLG